jgi:hypothetical protein
MVRNSFTFVFNVGISNETAYHQMVKYNELSYVRTFTVLHFYLFLFLATSFRLPDHLQALV